MSRLVRIPWQREHPFRYAVTEWLVDVDKTALLLMDFQAAYVQPDVGLGPVLALHVGQGALGICVDVVEDA